MSQQVKAAGHIDTLVLTHANGDHVFGNELVKGAEIVALKACAEEIPEMPPQMMAEMLKAAPALGDAGQYFASSVSAFDFSSIILTTGIELK